MILRRIFVSILLGVSILLSACGKTANDGVIDVSQLESSIPSETELSVDEINNHLREVRNDATTLWNEVFFKVKWYICNGSSSTSENLDIDAIISEMGDFYNILSEDKVFVDSLNEDYTEIINTYDVMFDEATTIYDYLVVEVPEPFSDIAYSANIDAYYEDLVDFNSLISALPYPEIDTFTDDIEVSEGLLTVTINLPAEFISDDFTQEQVDAAVIENGYISGMLNEDGSVSYIMTAWRHSALLNEFAESYEDYFEEYISSEDNVHIVSIDHNSDFTEYTILYDGDTIALSDSMICMVLASYGRIYTAFSSDSITECVRVTYINSETGETIDEREITEFIV